MRYLRNLQNTITAKREQADRYHAAADRADRVGLPESAAMARAHALYLDAEVQAMLQVAESL